MADSYLKQFWTFAFQLALNTPPEMQRTDLSLPVLQLKALGIENIVRFEFPSSPPAKNLVILFESRIEFNQNIQPSFKIELTG